MTARRLKGEKYCIFKCGLRRYILYMIYICIHINDRVNDTIIT